jgi:hypothetical protein
LPHGRGHVIDCIMLPLLVKLPPTLRAQKETLRDANAGYHVSSDGLDLEYIINLVYVLYLTDCMYVKGVLDGKYELR